jgi:hypothetical protein
VAGGEIVDDSGGTLIRGRWFNGEAQSDRITFETANAAMGKSPVERPLKPLAHLVEPAKGGGQLADLHDGLDLDCETQGQCGDPDSGSSWSTSISEDPRQQIRGAIGHQVLLGEVGC